MNLFAAIQAGGRSQRMGTDKAWLEIEGRAMIEHVLSAVQPLASRLALVISQTTLQQDRYAALAQQWQAELLIDAYDQRGPLGGIATALRHCRANESALIVACDLPFLTTDFLRRLSANHLPDLTIPEDPTQRKQMLCGIYDQACLPVAERLLAENKLRVDGLCEHLKTHTLRWNDYAHLPAAERLLLNCNAPDDLNPMRYKKQ